MTDGANAFVRKGFLTLGFLFFMFMNNSESYAQEPITMKGTLEYLNKKFEGYCLFKDKKKYIEVSFYKGSEIYRIDKLFLKDMDPETVSWSDEEKAVIARCSNKYKECIEREIIHLNKIDHYNRLSLPLDENDKKSIEGVKGALIYMIKLAIYSDHVRTEPFE